MPASGPVAVPMSGPVAGSPGWRSCGGRPNLSGTRRRARHLRGCASGGFPSGQERFNPITLRRVPRHGKHSPLPRTVTRAPTCLLQRISGDGGSGRAQVSRIERTPGRERRRASLARRPPGPEGMGTSNSRSTAPLNLRASTTATASRRSAQRIKRRNVVVKSASQGLEGSSLTGWDSPWRTTPRSGRGLERFIHRLWMTDPSRVTGRDRGCHDRCHGTPCHDRHCQEHLHDPTMDP